MNPIYQTKFKIGNGNCVAACVATILGKKIEDIDPNIDLVKEIEEANNIQDEELKNKRRREIENIYQEIYEAKFKELNIELWPITNELIKKEYVSIEKNDRITDFKNRYCIIDIPFSSLYNRKANVYCYNLNTFSGHVIVGYIDKKGRLSVSHDPAATENNPDYKNFMKPNNCVWRISKGINKIEFVLPRIK